MALVQNQVSLLVGANGFALWHYRTPDLKATIHGANYFNGVAGQLNVGDFICYNTSDANEMASVVSISVAGVVVISAGTAVMSASAEQKAAIEKAMTPEERAAKKIADEKAAAELEAAKKADVAAKEAAAKAKAEEDARQHQAAQHPSQQSPRTQGPGR